MLSHAPLKQKPYNDKCLTIKATVITVMSYISAGMPI